MNKTALLLGVGASLLLAAGAANAGTCTTEIQALQAQMGVQSPAPGSDLSSDSTTTMDSDTTATADSDADTGAGAAEPSVEQPDASGGATVQNDSGTGTTDGSGTIVPEGDSSADATAGAAEPSVEQPDASAGGEATADTGQPTDLGTPSPDVTETSRTGEVGTNAEAMAALERAQNHDKAGDEEACMTEVDAAKQALGIQ